VTKSIPPNAGARRLAALAILLAAGGGLALVAVPQFLAPAEPHVERSVGLIRLTDGELQYTYHLVTGSEALFDLGDDPRALRNLALQQPNDLSRMRARLLADLGVASLEVLRAPHRQTIRRLEALGYL
jgi:hypothetical protein